MSDSTPHLGLPLIAASQAQKHVTHNEALGLLDALVQLACLDKDLTAPPPSPAEGDRYLVAAANPGGAWAGLAGQVVRYSDGVWTGAVPRAGWLAYVVDEADLYVFDGTAWTSLRRTLTASQSVSRLGINTGADDTNRLAVKADATLLTWDDVTPGSGDMRITVNKKAAARDAGFVFQTGYATRALFGTLGGDDFVLKTSPDGAAFTTALTAAAATGVVGFAASPTAPTPAARDNTTRLATTAYVDRADAAAFARTQVEDAAYAIQPGDRTVAVIALTQARTLTLPAASAYPQGATLTILDESGAASAALRLTVATAGADRVNGAASAAIVVPYGFLALQSNGFDKWTIVDETAGATPALLGAPVGTFLFTPGGDGTVSLFRSTVAHGPNPRGTTLSGVSGTTLTLSGANDAGLFYDAAMQGVSLARIWNTTRGTAAWIAAVPAANQLAVTSAADVSAWAPGDAVQLGDPPAQHGGLNVVALDPSPMLARLFGRAFPQTGILCKAALIGAQASLALSGSAVGGSFVAVSSPGDASLANGMILVPCTVPSPVSAANLVFLRETIAGSGSITISLASSLAVFA
ncbi:MULTISPECIES: DUF2793 domain-containing protein [unclassified Methylobacterium]|jgi:hypothetical protein|uniref:DUF2793 domain-containing protein n=1 Tax=unclassified Methylobacterium TaxID=2615210 RepID=UPI001FED5879|nr:DUF2793 domain-containing protein [Methylobacterium sp. 2A]